MKKTFKKTLTLLLTVMMIISIIPLTASAATYGNLTYSISNDEITITDCNTFAAVVEIPETINGIPVTCIGEWAFSNLSNLTSITIPDSVTKIEAWAFYKCLSLTSITIPSSVTKIGIEAFDWCPALTNLIVNEENKYYSNDEYGVLFNKNKTMLVKYPEGNTRTTYTIPDSVTSIGNHAFSRCTALESIIIPDSVTDLGNYTFYECISLADITIPNSITSIGEWVFSWCTALESIVIPDSVTSIGGNSFTCCSSLVNITIPNSVTSIEGLAFRYCTSLASIIIPNGVTCIDEYTFYGCTALKNITIPDSIVSIAKYAFYDCSSLVSITIPNSVIHIGNQAFRGCLSLTSIKINNQFCEISDSPYTIDDNTTIYGYCGSTAQAYAENYNRNFVSVHNYNVVKVSTPTCTTQGYTTYICDCGDTYIADYVDATGHDMSNWVNDVTTNTATRECNNCDYSETVPLTNQGEGDVEIEAPEQPDYDFEVDEPEKDSDTYILAQQVVADNIGNNTEVLKVFDITLKNSDGVHIQPDGSVKVKLPLDWEKDGNYKVYRVNDDGTLTDMNAYRQGSHMVFDTDHFSIYVIVEETPEKEKVSFFDFLKNIFNCFKDIIQKIADVFRTLCDYT